MAAVLFLMHLSAFSGMKRSSSGRQRDAAYKIPQVQFKNPSVKRKKIFLWVSSKVYLFVQK
jgi:hypothetical protein